jgi:hypothetical protein
MGGSLLGEAEEGERIRKKGREVVKDEQGDEERGFLPFIAFVSGTNQSIKPTNITKYSNLFVVYRVSLPTYLSTPYHFPSPSPAILALDSPITSAPSHTILGLVSAPYPSSGPSIVTLLLSIGFSTCNIQPANRQFLRSCIYSRPIYCSRSHALLLDHL